MKNFLEMLFEEYLCNEIEGMKALTDNDLIKPNARLTEFLDNNGVCLDYDNQAEIDDITATFTYAAERCGFLNGVKLGFRIYQELTNKN